MSDITKLQKLAAGVAIGLVLASGCARALSVGDIESSSAHTGVRFSVDLRTGKLIIPITSLKPVIERFLNSLAEVDRSSGRTVSEHAKLLGPPESMMSSSTASSPSIEQSEISRLRDTSLVPPALIAQAAVSADGFDVEIAESSTEISYTAVLPADYDFEVEILGSLDEVSDTFVFGGSPDIDSLATDVVIGSGNGVVIVNKGDTLTEIAQAIGVQGISSQQMTMALLRANRSSFIDENVNLVKAGAILRIPDDAELTRMSQAQAVVLLREHNQLWRGYHDNNRGLVASQMSASSLVASSTDVARAELSDAVQRIPEEAKNEMPSHTELSIIAENDSTTTTINATADNKESRADTKLSDLNRRLQLVKEELISTRLESIDLYEQSAELQTTAANMESLIIIREQEVAKLERQLKHASADPTSKSNFVHKTQVVVANAEIALTDSDDTTAGATKNALFKYKGIVTIALAFFIVSASPGPAVIAVAVSSMSGGRHAGLMLGTGLSIGLGFWGVVAATGMGAVLQQNESLFLAFKIAGGIYLLWLAYQSGKSALQKTEPLERMQPRNRWFIRGLTLNLANPKAVVAWMAVLSLGLGEDGNGALVLSTLVCLFLGFLIYYFYAIVFSISGAMEKYKQFRRRIDGGISLLFAAAGIKLIGTAI